MLKFQHKNLTAPTDVAFDDRAMSKDPLSIRRAAAVIITASGVALLSSCATRTDSIPAPETHSGSARALGSAAAEQRPGIATSRGKKLKSSRHYSDFQRASERPASVAKIYYNDQQGISAMAGNKKKPRPAMQKTELGLVEWGVKGAVGMLKHYHANGQRYIVGEAGSPYALMVKNLCRQPLEILLSVDGYDVIDGEYASFKKRGYLVEPGKTLTIEGFRSDSSTVRSFVFSSVADSFGQKKQGENKHAGVMGLAVFPPQGVDPWQKGKQAFGTSIENTPPPATAVEPASGRPFRMAR